MSDTAQAMSCQEFVEVVTDYLEQQMTQARQRWTDEHLAGCDACQAYLEQMRQTIHTLRGALDQPWDVGQHQLTLVSLDRAQNRVERRERIVGDLRLGSGQGRKQ